MAFRSRATAEADIHPIDVVPPVRQLIPLSLQHVLVSYAGMATLPLLIGIGIGLSTEEIAILVSANLMIGGLATVLQSIGLFNIGVRYPIVMGSTFTGITPAIIVGQDAGLPAVFGATIVVGVLTYFIAPFYSKLLRYFPPIVTGTIIAIIGFSLIPSAATLIGSGDGEGPTLGPLLLAGGTMALVIALQKLAPPVIGRAAILIALIVGTLIALPLDMADFSSVGDAPLVGIVTPFEFGPPTFVIAAILPMMVVQLVNMVECTGDTLAVGEIVGKETGPNEVARALRADGVSTAVAGVFNSFTMVAFGNSVGLLTITRVYSRYVVALAGAFLFVIGMLPQFGAVIASLPGPVLGGIAIIIFGTIGAVGVRILLRSDLDDPRNLMIVAVSFGFGLMPVGAPYFYEKFPDSVQTVLGSGIAAGAIAAFILNLLLNGPTPKEVESSDADAAPDAGEAEEVGPESAAVPRPRGEAVPERVLEGEPEGERS